MSLARPALVLLTALGATLAWAADPNPASLYDVTGSVSPTSLKQGEKGTFTLTIQSKKGAHVSQEAPMKIELTGKNVTLAKQKLALADSVAKPVEGSQYTEPRFEVPFTATAAGQGSADAKLTFFICTDTICARQEKKVSVPVEVK